LSSLVFTIGHSTRAFKQFAGLLRGDGIEHLVDVRRFPHSRRHPHFDVGVLPEELREGVGPGYTHLPELGGRRQPRLDSPNTGWRNPSFHGYADHMGTPEFREGLRRLLDLRERERVCLMCSEAVWWRCHRRMISDSPSCATLRWSTSSAKVGGKPTRSPRSPKSCTARNSSTPTNPVACETREVWAGRPGEPRFRGSSPPEPPPP
jgi:hypothetical protein